MADPGNIVWLQFRNHEKGFTTAIGPYFNNPHELDLLRINLRTFCEDCIASSEVKSLANSIFNHPYRTKELVDLDESVVRFTVNWSFENNADLTADVLVAEPGIRATFYTVRTHDVSKMPGISLDPSAVGKSILPYILSGTPEFGYQPHVHTYLDSSQAIAHAKSLHEAFSEPAGPKFDNFEEAQGTGHCELLYGLVVSSSGEAKHLVSVSKVEAISYLRFDRIFRNLKEDESS